MLWKSLGYHHGRKQIFILSNPSLYWVFVFKRVAKKITMFSRHGTALSMQYLFWSLCLQDKFQDGHVVQTLTIEWCVVTLETRKHDELNNFFPQTFNGVLVRVVKYYTLTGHKTVVTLLMLCLISCGDGQVWRWSCLTTVKVDDRCVHSVTVVWYVVITSWIGSHRSWSPWWEQECHPCWAAQRLSGWGNDRNRELWVIEGRSDKAMI